MLEVLFKVLAQVLFLAELCVLHIPEYPHLHVGSEHLYIFCNLAALALDGQELACVCAGVGIITFGSPSTVHLAPFGPYRD
jgi:hypothetical protein